MGSEVQDVRVVVSKLEKVEGTKRLVGWAYIARKADGTLADDSGGTTRDAAGNVIADATAGDIVDTPEAEKAFADALYGFLSSGKATGDVMHVDFDQTRIVGGMWIDQDVAKAMGVPAGILPTGALVVIEIPDTEKGAELWKRYDSGELRSLSAVLSIERVPVEESEIRHAG